MNNRDVLANWPLVGNQKIGQVITAALDQGTLPPAIAFVGPKQVGKKTAALWLAQRNLCQGVKIKPCGQCPDCRQIKNGTHLAVTLVTEEQSGQAITIDNIREILSGYKLKGIGGKRWLIINQAERLTESARNALLKFVEEPPRDINIILTAPNEKVIPETLRSRMAIYRWQRVDEKEIRKNFPSASAGQIFLAGGRPGEVAKMIGQEYWSQGLREAAHRVAMNLRGRINETDDEAAKYMIQEETAIRLLVQERYGIIPADDWIGSEDRSIISKTNTNNLINKLNTYVNRGEYIKANVSINSVYAYVQNS